MRKDFLLLQEKIQKSLKKEKRFFEEKKPVSSFSVFLFCFFFLVYCSNCNASIQIFHKAKISNGA